jgi:galactose mutarotase-like enzyme
MKAQARLITLRDGLGEALIAPELGGWLLRYAREIPGLGCVDAIHFSQEVVDRYPNQMYAGNPLLFPQVSFNHLPGREHHYEWKGKEYALPQHGFARRLPWRVIDVSETRVCMELAESEATRRAYPFSFRMEVAYELREGCLHYHQLVENLTEEEMPFSTGIHPYLQVLGKREAGYLELPNALQVQTSDMWRTWRTEPFERKQFPLKEDVSGTLFLTELTTPEISLVDPVGGLRTTLNFADSPLHRFVALWSRTNADPFYCIEPWTALPNAFARNGAELIRLSPGAKFEAAMWFNLTLHDFEGKAD